MDAIISFMVEWGYVGLFISAFIAGSILPFSSELVMLLLVQMGLNPVICVLSAGIGNTLGGMTCFWIGRLGKLEWIEKYLGVKREKIDKARNFVSGRGAMMAFFAFLPFIGEAIAIALGYMRSNSWVTALSMFAGKVLRYAVLLIAFQYGIDWLMQMFPEIQDALDKIKVN